jgi:nuclear pore complex protein Nup155
VDRLLAVDSPFVVQFLQNSAESDVQRADLLWQFHARREQFYEAAKVQLDLAKSAFPIALSKRMEYLSRAKANASTPTNGIGRQARQVLLYEITELLDVANIQDELLTRLRGDSRVQVERREEVTKPLDGQILNLTEVSDIPSSFHSFIVG